VPEAGRSSRITSPIPYDGHIFKIDLDFIDHTLLIRTSQGV
jgi:hypothetical protein